MKLKINNVQLFYLQYTYKINLAILIFGMLLRMYFSANVVFADDEQLVTQVINLDKDLNSISSNPTGAVGSRPARDLLGSMAKKAIPQEYKDALGGNLVVQVKKSIKLDAESIGQLGDAVKDKLSEVISGPKQEAAVSRNPNTVPFGPMENPKRDLITSSSYQHNAAVQALSGKQQSNIPPEFHKKIVFGKYTQSNIPSSSNNTSSSNEHVFITSKL